MIFPAFFHVYQKVYVPLTTPWPALSKVQHGTFRTPVVTGHLAQHELGLPQGADSQEDQHLVRCYTTG